MLIRGVPVTGSRRNGSLAPSSRSSFRKACSMRAIFRRLMGVRDACSCAWMRLAFSCPRRLFSILNAVSASTTVSPLSVRGKWTPLKTPGDAMITPEANPDAVPRKTSLLGRLTC